MPAILTHPTTTTVTSTPVLAESGEAVPVTHRSLFAAHRGRILFTYALLVVENVLRLAQPLVLGLAINDLLASSYHGLLLFVVQHLASMLVGTVRQMYDTRVYADIATDIATGHDTGQQSPDIEPSRLAARSARSRVDVDFFERSIPTLLRASFSIGGALLLLGWYDASLIPLCLLLIVPAGLLNAAYGRKTLMLSTRLNDEFDREGDVIQQSDPRRTRQHFDALGHWRVKLSDAEAIKFALMELFVLGLLATTLVHYCTSGHSLTGGPIGPGDIFAVFRYVLLFIAGLETVPKISRLFSRPFQMDN